MYDLVVLPHQLPACAEAAATLPGLTFVLDHLGKPPVAAGALDPWASGLRALAALPNTVAKLSGLLTEADPGSWSVAGLRPYADTALDVFGPDRLMYGSDWPVCTQVAAYHQVINISAELTAGLDEREKEAVLARTASRVYGV